MKKLNRLLKGKNHVVFIDLEGTQFSHEMIAFGAVKTKIDENGNIIKTYKGFKEYVRPKNQIGKFVINLTGITEAKLRKDGISYKEVIKKFKSYCGLHFKKMVFVTFGSHDIRIFSQSLLESSDASKDDVKLICKNHIDYSVFISEFVKDEEGNPLSLLNNLKFLNVPLEGDAHDPLYDAINLAHLWQAFLDNRDLISKSYLKVMQKMSHLPAPVQKAVRRLAQGEDVTSDEFLKSIEEYVGD